MKIAKIRIKNFKGIKELNYEPNSPIGLLTGKIGAGKTSFIQALELVFGNKHNNKSFIRYGEETAMVTVEMEEGPIFSRCLSTNKKVAPYQINGKSCTAIDFDKNLEFVTGIKSDDFKILSSAHIFEELNSEDFSKFIMEHIPEKIPFSSLNFKDNVSKKGQEILKEKLGESFTPTDFSALYSEFYSERRELKRIAKNLCPSESVEKPFFTDKDVEENSENIVKKESSLMSAKSIVSAYQSLVKNYNAVGMERKKSLDEAKAAFCKEPDKANETSLKEKLLLIQKSKSNAEGTIRVLKNNIKLYQKTLDNLGGNVCPISEKLICSTDKTALKNELNQMINDNNLEIKKAQEQINKLLGSEKEINKLIEKETLSKIAYEKFLILRKKYESIVLPEKPVRTKEVDQAMKILETEEKVQKEIASAKNDLKTDREILVKYNAYVQGKKAYEEANENYKVYDELVKYTDPKGTTTQNLLSSYFDVFNNACTEITDSMSSDIKVSFGYSNGFACTCQRADGAVRLYSQLSNGEKVIVSFIVLSVLNRLVGNQIMFIDNINELDSNYAKKLIEMLNHYKEYDHIFLSFLDYKELKEIFNAISSDFVIK